MKGKTDTFVLDFVNKPDMIQESFQPYFQGTILSEETDPNKLYTIEQEIRKYNLFTDDEVKYFVEVFYDERIPDEELQPILDTVVEKWWELEEDDREMFRHHIQGFIRLYGYVSQIITFKDINLEKLYIFLRFLNKKLPKRPKEKLIDILSYVDLEYFRIEQKHKNIQIYLNPVEGELFPITGEVGGVSEEPTDLLSHIIQILNDSFGSDLTDDDRINLEKVQRRLIDDSELLKVHMGDNTESNKRHVFNKVFDRILLGLVDDNLNFFKKLTEPNRNKYVKDVLFGDYVKKVG